MSGMMTGNFGSNSASSTLATAKAINGPASVTMIDIGRLVLVRIRWTLCCAMSIAISNAIIDSTQLEYAPMSSLIVRGVDEAVVNALKMRATRHGRSTEAEHRALLAEVLLQPRRRPLAEVLATMPNVGEDADFEREQGGEADRVFG